MLTAKIASGVWDGIITTHSSFERIGMSRAFQEGFLREQIAAYDQLLCDRAAADTSRAHRNILVLALQLDGNLLEALFNRALCYEKQSRSDEAKADWNEYLKRDSTSPWADEARRHLTS